MNAWTQWTAKTLMLTAGFAATGVGLSTAAFASTGPGAVTSGTGSVASGNQVSAPVSAPVDVCGNAVGNARAHCHGGAVVHDAGGTKSLVTNGNGSVGSGNQVSAPVSAPVDVCGNSVAVLGVAGADCKGGAAVGGGHGHTPPGQCGCQKGSSAVTSLLPAVAKAMSSTPLKLTAYNVGRPSALTATKGAVTKGATTKNAGLGTLPVVAGLPSLAGLTSLSNLAAKPEAALLPKSVLSANESGAMSVASFFTLTGGMVLAGISALTLSGRRARGVRRGRKAAA